MAARLRTLQPRLRRFNGQRVRTLGVNPGATPRLSDRSGHAWAKKRELVLGEEPLCRPCLQAAPTRVAASVEVDHILALEDGGTDDRSNLQGICRACHVEKSAKERRGRTSGLRY